MALHTPGLSLVEQHALNNRLIEIETEHFHKPRNVNQRGEYINLPIPGIV